MRPLKRLKRLRNLTPGRQKSKRPRRRRIRSVWRRIRKTAQDVKQARAKRSEKWAVRRHRFRLVKSAIRSGFRRYPREVIASLREGTVPRVVPSTVSLEQIDEHLLAAAWLGHASVLARLDGLNLLIDPVFSDRIGKRLGKITVGPKRINHAPVAPEDLPHIDILLITHAHFDHLDRPTLQNLVDTKTVVVTAPGTRRLIPEGFGKVIELSPGQTTTLHGLELRAIAPRHWGSRVLFDRHRKCNSYFAQSSHGSILFAGDTAYTDVFTELSSVELAVFGIGSYDPWVHMHATPEQVWSMYRDLGAKWLLPVHHSTFSLSNEPIEEPMLRLFAAARGNLDRILQVDPGELWVGRTLAPSRPSA